MSTAWATILILTARELGAPGRHETAFPGLLRAGARGRRLGMVVNSVRREDGTTTAFWQFKYDDRLSERGVLAPDQNYYNAARRPETAQHNTRLSNRPGEFHRKLRK